MKKNKLKFIGSFIGIIFAVSAYILFANWDYLINKQDDGVNIKQSQLELLSWDGNENTIIAKDDPQIIINDMFGYIDYIEMRCDIQPEQLSPVVYLGTGFSNSFKEANSFVPEYTYESGILKIKIDNKSPKIRIDLTENEGFILSNLGAIVKYPKGITCDPLIAVLCVLFVCIICIPMFVPQKEWGSVAAYIEGLKKYNYLLSNLVKKDITTKYRRSVLGILWSVLNPLLMMLVITAVFQKLFRFSVNNFPIYYLTGSLIFNFVSDATTGSMYSILSSSGLIRKVYIPKYIFPLQKCLFSLVNMCFSLIAIVIIFIVLQFKPPATIFLSFIPMIYTFIFSFGFGLILSTLIVFFRDVGHLYAVWTTAWMYLTPIIYPVDILPNIMFRIIKLNPMYYFVTYFRNVVMDGIVPDWRMNTICLLFSFGFLAIGLIVFKKKQDKFILFM